MTDVFDFSAFPILTTERLILRQLTHDDAAAMMALFSAPESLQFLDMSPMETREKAIELIDWFNGLYDKHEAVQWAFTLRGAADADRMIGTGGNYAWDREHRHVDIGYHILPSHWGRGYATEAARAIIGWSFENLDVHRIQADCTEGHIASERVMLKCGFQLEGIWRESCWEHGRFVNIKQFGLLRREYESL